MSSTPAGMNGACGPARVPVRTAPRMSAGPATLRGTTIGADQAVRMLRLFAAHLGVAIEG